MAEVEYEKRQLDYTRVYFKKFYRPLYSTLARQSTSFEAVSTQKPISEMYPLPDLPVRKVTRSPQRSIARSEQMLKLGLVRPSMQFVLK
ncbi:hypothetical protein SS50377_28521 [Spironucleus salmonicida]|nr:hypothetical protein SS50377_28487 [Spironucleus salmonicida]KAH0569567.1 hypothetical protein SS50377_28521 [Spironucleus salmonicida]